MQYDRKSKPVFAENVAEIKKPFTISLPILETTPNNFPPEISKPRFKVCVLPDIHAPLHEKRAIDSALEAIKYEKPDIIVQLGDLCDADSISRFEKKQDKDYSSIFREIDSANEILDRIEAVAPKAQKIVLEGNHDQRFESWGLNIQNHETKRLLGRNIFPWYEEFHLKKRGWYWLEYNRPLRIGKAFFKHGFYINQYHAFKNLTKGNTKFESVFYGHTHQYQVACISGRHGLPVSAISLGTLSRFDLSYLRGETPDWCHMICFIDFWNDGCFTAHPIPIIDGKFSFCDKIYG